MPEVEVVDPSDIKAPSVETVDPSELKAVPGTLKKVTGAVLDLGADYAKVFSKGRENAGEFIKGVLNSGASAGAAESGFPQAHPEMMPGFQKQTEQGVKHAAGAGPLLPLTEATPKPGIERGIASVAEGGTTPANIGIIAGTGAVGSLAAGATPEIKAGYHVLETMLSAYFSQDMIRHSTIPAIHRAREAFQKGDLAGLQQAATEAGLTGILGILAGVHAGSAGKSVVKDAISDPQFREAHAAAGKAYAERHALETQQEKTARRFADALPKEEKPSEPSAESSSGAGGADAPETKGREKEAQAAVAAPKEEVAPVKKVEEKPEEQVPEKQEAQAEPKPEPIPEKAVEPKQEEPLPVAAKVEEPAEEEPVPAPAVAPRGIPEVESKPFQQGSATPSYVALNSMLGGLHEPVSTFIEKDVAPTIKAAAHTAVEAGDDFLRVLAPSTRGEAGQKAGMILRGKLGELARKYDQASDALKASRKALEDRSPDENYEFIDRVESGAKQATLPEQKIANSLRRMLDERREQVRSLGTGKLDEFYENYFPHIWKDPKQAANVFSRFFSKKPLEGGKSFLKQRSLPTIKDGLKAGLRPVSDNPIDLVLLKAREMDRYVMAHESLKEMKSQGIVKFAKLGERGPEGWRKVEDPIGGVYSRNESGELVLRGNYYAHDGAAQILNNYLTPGLRTKSGMYRALLGANNVLNQFQLGFSAFHLGFTSADAAVSRASLGFEQMFRGNPAKAAKSFAGVPVAPFATYFKGSKLLKEWYKPAGQGGQMAAIADELMRAGGRARMDDLYQTNMIREMSKAWREGNVIGAALRLPFAAVEAAAMPIMEHLVPRQKLGVFTDMARYEMEKHSERLEAAAKLPKEEQEAAKQNAVTDLRRHMQQAWDSVENRMGQMTYDNLFWNRTAKDIAMLSVRSVGWNLGTIREIGGAPIDVLKQPVNKLRGQPVNAKRMSYVLGLVSVGAMSGAVYQYLMTGKGPGELKDYFFPHNGQLDQGGHPMRVELPLYIKDVYRYGTNPVKTISGKMSPFLNEVIAMVHNQDYFGNQIRNPGDPLVQQLMEEAQYVGGEFAPMGVRNYEKQEGQPFSARAQNFVGVTPAPADIDKTKAERLAGALGRKYAPVAGRTKEQVATRDIEHKITSDARHRDEKAVDEADKAVAEGKLSERQATSALEASQSTPLQLSFKRLPINDAIKVYEAATPEERESLKEMFYKKAYDAWDKTPPGRQQGLIDKIRPLLK